MPHAIRIHANGGPDVMKWEEIAVGDPGPGEARVRHTAVGVNYIDTYHRSGLYKLALPSGIGSEGAGVVEAVGAGVDWVKAGDRVAYCGGPLGSYSEVRVMPAERLVRIPDGISERVAATLMLKGLTVQYLFRQTYRLKAGETILFHAAAGGVGLIACQWARALGVTMIGTVGSDDKAALAQGERLHAHDRLHPREFRRAGQGADRRQGRSGRLRRRRQGHVPGLARLPRAARDVRELRQCIGPGAAVRHPAAVAEGFAVRDAAHAGHLHREARGHRGDGGRDVRSGQSREDRERAAADVRTEGCGGRASRARIARDDRRDAS